MTFIFKFLGSLFGTVVSILERPASPTAPVTVAGKPDVIATLKAYLLAHTLSAGPFPTTGGQIHVISPATAETVASLIVTYASEFGLKVSILASYVAQESTGDPLAVNPNHEDAKPNETPEEAFAHTDIGIAQIDGSTLLGMSELKGLTLAEIETKAYDPSWALAVMANIIAKNENEMVAAFHADPTLKAATPNGDIRIAASNAYNSGLSGTIASLRSGHPNLTYGQQVVARADSLAPLLDVA